VFSKFRLVRWGWLSGTVSVLVGVFILAIFLALFNYLTPVLVGGEERFFAVVLCLVV
jgi:hypothetical protein